MSDCLGFGVECHVLIPGEREVSLLVLCALLQISGTVEPYLWVMPCSLRGVFRDPPKGEEYVGSFLHGEYLKTFLSEVLPML